MLMFGGLGKACCWKDEVEVLDVLGRRKTCMRKKCDKNIEGQYGVFMGLRSC